jgi:PAS domain S-box-containing protein
MPNPSATSNRSPHRAPPSTSSHVRTPQGRQRSFLFAIVIVTGLTCAVTALAFFRARAEIREEFEKQLATIAEQKREQIEQLLIEMRRDADLYASPNSEIARQIARWVAGRQPDAELGTRIRRRLEEIARAHRYLSVALFDAAGHPLLMIGSPAAVEHAPDTAAAISAARTSLVDLHRNADGRIEFGMLSAVRADGPRPIAAIYLAKDGATSLYALIERWPIPTRTAETLLVRKEGDTVQFVSPLRHQAGTEFSLRRPLRFLELPAAAAALGHHGLHRGRDYRGAPVLAYTTPIAGSPWAMIAKMDEAEADASVRRLAGWTAAAFFLLFVGLLAIGFAWLRHDRQRRAIAALLDQRESEARFRVLYENAPLGIALIGSLTGPIHQANQRFADITGRPREELVTLDWMRITHPDDVQDDMDHMARLNAGEISEFRMNKRYLRPDGSPVWINMMIAPLGIDIGQGPTHVCMVEDITARIDAEAALQRSEGHYRLLF